MSLDRWIDGGLGGGARRDYDNAAGRATDPDAPTCIECQQPIRDDFWRGRPGHMVCGRCHEKAAEKAGARFDELTRMLGLQK